MPREQERGCHRDDVEHDGEAPDGAEADRGDQHAGEDGADDAREVHAAHLQRDGVHELVLRDQLRHERVAGGHGQRDREPEEECAHQQVPELDQVGDDQDPERGVREGDDALREQQQRALVVAVGDDAAERRDEEHRQRDGDGDEAERRGGVGELEREEASQQLVHLHRHEEGEVAAEVDCVVALVERGEGALPVPEATRGAPVGARSAIVTGRSGRVRPVAAHSAPIAACARVAAARVSVSLRVRSHAPCRRGPPTLRELPIRA